MCAPQFACFSAFAALQQNLLPTQVRVVATGIV